MSQNANNRRIASLLAEHTVKLGTDACVVNGNEVVVPTSGVWQTRAVVTSRGIEIVRTSMRDSSEGRTRLGQNVSMKDAASQLVASATQGQALSDADDLPF